MSDYFNAGNVPPTGGSGSSAQMRAEFDAIEVGISDKLPTLTGQGDYVVKVNSGGSTLEAVVTLAVAQGGTGAATFTDGGILLGSGTGAITALRVLTNGEMIVGDGTTDPAIESGATLRTSMGLGTSDNVTFTNVTATGALTGTLATAAQTNITSLGTLTDLTVTGDFTFDANVIASTIGGPALLDVAGGSTTPNIVGASGFQTTGMSAVANTGYLISQNIGALSWTSTAVSILNDLEVADQILMGAGTVAAPGLSISGDPNSGWFSGGQGEMSFSSDGVKALHLADVGVTISHATAPTLNIRSNAAAIVDDTEFATIAFMADDTGSGDESIGASIFAEGAGTWGASDQPSRIVFATDESGTLTNQFKVDGDAFRSAVAGGPQINNVAANTTVPVFLPDRANPENGIGADPGGGMSFIQNNVSVMGCQDDYVSVSKPFKVTSYTVATVPAASPAIDRAIIHVSDGDGGSECLAMYEHGTTSWLRIVLGAAVST